MPHRRANRYAEDTPGHVIVKGGAHACTVYDKTKTHARLTSFSNHLELPNEFSIKVGDTIETCWLIWHADGEAGISFSKPKA